MGKSSEPSNSKYLQRINYLHQVEKFTLLSMKNAPLSAYYGIVRDSLIKKAVLKEDPNMKRGICKKCKCIQYDGITAKVTLRKRRKKNKNIYALWKCLNCNFVKRYPINKKDNSNQLWYENAESIVEIQKH